MIEGFAYAGAAQEYADHMTGAFEEWWTAAEEHGYRREQYVFYREMMAARAMAELTTALQMATEHLA